MSVVMPVYNGEAHVATAVRSILNQTFVDFELIVVDDGSTDATADIVGDSGDSRIRLARLVVNGGIAKALNHGLNLAEGDLIARMDSDDIARPNRLQRQVEFMDSEPSIAVCGSSMQAVGEPQWVYRQPTGDRAIRARLRYASALAHPTVIFRSALLPHGEFRYDPAWVPVEDFELWVRLARTPTLRFANLPEVLLEYRLPAQPRAEYQKRQRHLAADLAVGEARSANLITNDQEVAAFSSLVTLLPPRRGSWSDVTALIGLWADDGEAEQTEFRGRWRQMLRQASLSDGPAAALAARHLGITEAVFAVVMIVFGNLRRSRVGDWVVGRLRSVRVASHRLAERRLGGRAR